MRKKLISIYVCFDRKIDQKSKIFNIGICNFTKRDFAPIIEEFLNDYKLSKDQISSLYENKKVLFNNFTMPNFSGVTTIFITEAELNKLSVVDLSSNVTLD